jgi:hypothetical protein
MMLDRHSANVLREVHTRPETSAGSVRETVAAVRRRAARAGGLESWAIHLSLDRTRIVTLEAWRDPGSFRRDPDSREPGSVLYRRAAVGGRDPTPVADADAGAIIIDIFRVWRPLVRPVSAFNVLNGKAFTRAPGCISTTVLRGATIGQIATYARWRTVNDFLAAFEANTGRGASSTADVNAATAKMTLGLIRTDYHAHELLDASEAFR